MDGIQRVTVEYLSQLLRSQRALATQLNIEQAGNIRRGMTPRAIDFGDMPVNNNDVNRMNLQFQNMNINR